ncbi:MAG: ABC transporter permease [Clostridiales bacterium]|nr:ABC transporter permease [Clostridiales bacterium]
MSRIFTLTKNYLKLIFRAKSVIIITIVGALVVIAALTNVFHTLLDQAETGEDFTIGYEMSEDSKYSYAEEYIKEGFEDEGLTVVKYDNADPEKLIRDGSIDVFIDFGEDSYSIMGRSNAEIDARIVQYVLYNVDHIMNGDTASISVNTGSIEAAEQADADTYYCIVQTMYFASLCSVFLCLIYITERRQNIGIRFRSSTASGVHTYLGKLIACALTTWLSMVLITGGLVLFLFDIKLGHPVLSVAIMLFTTLAFIAFGMLFFIIFRNTAASIGLLFVVIWFWGYVGGCFETYMLSSVSQTVKQLSPLYYVNRTLVELSVNGSSDYLKPCLAVLTFMTVVSIGLGMFITAKKKEV